MTPADPETEAVDLRRKVWNLTRLGESLAGSGNLTIRRCGEQILATLGDAALPVADVLDRPTTGGAGSGTDDTGRAAPASSGQARERTGAVTVDPVAAAFDRESVRQIARMAIGRSWNHDPLGCDDHPAAERVTEAFWPLLEHAQAALTGNEGVRLWMVDCSELVAKHRERAEAAEEKLAALAAIISAERFRMLAAWFDTDDEFKVTMFPEKWPSRDHEVQDDLRKFADLLSGSEKKGGTPYDRDFTGPVL